MKRISIATLATIGLAILACGGGDEEAGGGDDGATATTTGTTGTTEPAAAAEPELVAVAVTEPWKAMDLPINNGTPVVSDKTHLLVAYNDGAISTYTTSYGGVIEKNGWKKKDDYSEPDFTAILYTKGSQELGFAVGNFEGKTVVYFEDLDGVPEDQRIVRKKGNANRGSLARKVQTHRPKHSSSGHSSSSSKSSNTGKKKGKGKGKGKGKKKKKKGGKKKR